MQTKKQYILDKIDFIKEQQSLEEYDFIKDCYDGMIDDLKILILNLEDDDEPLEPTTYKSKEDYEYQTNIDMSGASDNGDR